MIMKETINKVDFIKIKNFTLPKILLKEWKHKTQAGENVFKKTHFIKDCYPNSTKNS